jgi:hypothetical protein
MVDREAEDSGISGDADDAARQVEANMAVADYQTLMLLVM